VRSPPGSRVAVSGRPASTSAPVLEATTTHAPCVTLDSKGLTQPPNWLFDLDRATWGLNWFGAPARGWPVTL
jgi:hypothetical protein